MKRRSDALSTMFHLLLNTEHGIQQYQAFFFFFPLPYGGGLLTDGVTPPQNSRAATTSRWGGNQTLSDVYSDCLT